MSKFHPGKTALGFAVTGVVVGGLMVCGAVWLGRRLAASPAVQRAARLLRKLVEETVASADTPAGSETVFQADAASAPQPAWSTQSASPACPYGPN